VRAALAVQGVERLYSHQRRTYELLEAGHNVVVATGTASGKSLCFALPTVDACAKDPATRALYLYPTKALAQDQARKLSALRLPSAVPAVYDGDTPQGQRAQIRRSATIVLSNPDMLHIGILPSHERWAEFLHHLRFVVLDEAHVYRGVFGSHTAQVIRRLRRLCEAYGGHTSVRAHLGQPSPTRDPSPRGSSACPSQASPTTVPPSRADHRLLEPAPRGPRSGHAAKRPGGGQLHSDRGGAGRATRHRLRALAQGG